MSHTGFPFLALFSEKELKEEFEQHCITKHFPANSILVKEDEYVHYLPLLIKGSIKVMRHDDQGREMLVYHIHSGQSCIVSFSSLLLGKSSSIVAITEEDSDILLIPAEKIQLWTGKYASWNYFMYKLFYERFEDVLNMLHKVAFDKVGERLHALLESKRMAIGKNDISITHQQLANELGTAREVVSRTLKEMEKHGLIQLNRGMIRIISSL